MPCGLKTWFQIKLQLGFFFLFLYSPEFIEVRVYIHKHAQAFGKFAMQYYVLLLVYSMY